MVQYSVDLSSGITESFFESLVRLSDNKVTRKRLTEIVIELFQNIKQHSIAADSQTLTITKHDSHFSVETNNLVYSKDVEALQNRIKNLNKLDHVQLKKQHTRILKEGRLSEKSGAGLGFYRIALRTKSALKANFTQTQPDHFTFTLHVNLS